MLYIGIQTQYYLIKRKIQKKFIHEVLLNSDDDISERLLLDTIKLLLSPQWEIQLLGERFVVRTQSNDDDDNDAFLMSARDSEKLDQTIYAILNKRNILIDKKYTAIVKRNMRQNLSTISNTILQQ